jgi:hypothetical protein
MVGVFDDPVEDGEEGCEVDDGTRDVPVDDDDDGRATDDAVDDDRTTAAVEDDRSVPVDDGERITLAVDDRAGVVEPLKVATRGPVKKNGMDGSYSLR